MILFGCICVMTELLCIPRPVACFCAMFDNDSRFRCPSEEASIRLPGSAVDDVRSPVSFNVAMMLLMFLRVAELCVLCIVEGRYSRSTLSVIGCKCCV